jgi:pimeloyl-ACP methyl ester carboxylesterase
VAATGRRRRTLLRTAALILFVVLVGATYQGVTTALERRDLPAPGRLVRLADHQLHIYCTGSGSPSVILEAPATGMSAAWGWVQQDLQRQTRVCSYDRAGLGYSQWGGNAFEPADVPIELHALLDAAGERGPFVVAGQGLGAAFARLYAARFPNETAALVLIDPPATLDRDRVVRMMPASPWLARIGMLRATRWLDRAARGLPARSAEQMHTFLNRPDHLTRAAQEIEQWNRAMEMSRNADIGRIPATSVAAAGRAPVALLASRADAARAAAAIRAAVARVRRQPTT